MPSPLLIFSQSYCLHQIVNIKSQPEWQTVQIQISWLLIWIYTVCQRQSISGFSRTRVNSINWITKKWFPPILPESAMLQGMESYCIFPKYCDTLTLHACWTSLFYSEHSVVSDLVYSVCLGLSFPVRVAPVIFVWIHHTGYGEELVMEKDGRSRV